MANRTTITALMTGAFVCLAAASVPTVSLAGGGSGGGGKNCPPPPPPGNNQKTTVNQKTKVNVNLNVVTKVNVVNQVQSTSSAVNQTALANVASFSGYASMAGSSFLANNTVAGGGGSSGGVAEGAVSEGVIGVGGEEQSSYEAERTRFEKVVIQAFCFDDKDVPHPASQVFPERDIEAGYAGEVYRCIAGTHMQVTIAPFRDRISFEGGRTLTCGKGEALVHFPGPQGGRIECRPQLPARDCNERSLLRRFGAGVKVLTMVITEKYTASRTESHSSSSAMTYDGGVGGVAY